MIERATPILGVSLQPKRFVTSFPNMKLSACSRNSDPRLYCQPAAATLSPGCKHANKNTSESTCSCNKEVRYNGPSLIVSLQPKQHNSSPKVISDEGQ